MSNACLLACILASQKASHVASGCSALSLYCMSMASLLRSDLVSHTNSSHSVHCVPILDCQKSQLCIIPKPSNYILILHF